MKKRSIDRYIYSITKKPAHYIEVRNPPRTGMEKLARPQDARQLQYNRWSRYYGVYSGSFLPQDKSRLLKKGGKMKRQRLPKTTRRATPQLFTEEKAPINGFAMMLHIGIGIIGGRASGVHRN